MTSIKNCRNGQLVIEAPQNQIDAFLNHARGAGIHVARSATNKPEPMDIPDWDFPPLVKVASGADQNGRVRVLNEPQRTDGKPVPLPSCDLDFAPLKKIVGN